MEIRQTFHIQVDQSHFLTASLADPLELDAFYKWKGQQKLHASVLWRAKVWCLTKLLTKPVGIKVKTR